MHHNSDPMAINTFTPQLVNLELFISGFIDDISRLLRDRLENLRYNTTAITDPEKLITSYFSRLSRRVNSRPREVILPADFTIPGEVAIGFQTLKSKIEQGEDVNPHLSRLTAQIDKDDMMFSDWKINHFHLGTTTQTDGFVERTGPVLYAIVTEEKVYCVAIAEHGHWSDIEFLEIIDENWPELIADSRVDASFEVQLSSEDVKQWRKAKVNAGITLPNGHSYVAIGGGYMADGTPAEAIHNLIHLKNIAKDIYNQISKNELQSEDPDVAKHLSPLSFKLKERDGKLVLCCDQIKGYDLTLKLPPPPPLPV